MRTVPYTSELIEPEFRYVLVRLSSCEKVWGHLVYENKVHSPWVLHWTWRIDGKRRRIESIVSIVSGVRTPDMTVTVVAPSLFKY